MPSLTRRAGRGAAFLLLIASAAAAGSRPAPGRAASPDYPVQPVPFTAVRLADPFWAPRIETNRAVTIPFAFEKCEETERVALFDRAAAALQGREKEGKLPGYPFDDSDVYKVLEGASYVLSVRPDPKLDAYLDGLIVKIAAAQEPDGYLYPARTIRPDRPHPWSGARRWELEQVDSHELYNIGHLYEAAAAHFAATGKRSLLDVARKSADLLDRTFGPGKRAIWPGHQVTEMGLVRLYRATGEERYLRLARFLLDARGPNTGPGSGRDYNQSHARPVEQREAVGHAVRATYLYAGMADVAALAGAGEYVSAIDRIWEDVVGKKLYVTGGVGATGAGEAFGKPYELPNMSAYCETCAAVGNALWNQRLFLLHADARYVDVLERTLYNGLASGVSLDGKAFFYPNPLESNGQHARSPWFGVACCPGNITRFVASVPGYVYARRGRDLFVNLYAAGSADVALEGGPGIRLRQETRYPWDGAVRLHVEPEKRGRFALRLRVPGWARGEAVPSDLYRFLDPAAEPVTLRVNGKPAPLRLEAGYAVLDRRWKRGDVVELDLPMPVRRVIANERVEADRGRVALQRGPIVYCAEAPDHPGGRVRNLLLPDGAGLSPRFRPELLGGVTVLEGRAQALRKSETGALVREEQPFTAVPYAAWANRGRGQMLVWIPNREASARPLPAPTLASTARVRVSGGTSPTSIHDGAEPRSSGDESETFFHWWPRKGTTEWVEYAFPAPTRLSGASVYWFDDTGWGECRVPRSWRLLYRDGDAWKPVEAAGPFGVERDRYNEVTFRPVSTLGLRLEVTLQAGWSSGILEWQVKP